VLSIAAVLGKTFEFRDLEKLAEDKGDIEKIADRLIAEGLIEEDRESRGDRLTFSSGIVRDVLYAGLSRRGRRSLHRRYAEQLEAQNQGRLERVHPQLVLHFSEGDVPEKTVEYGLALARKSLDAFSSEETIHVTRTVLEFLKEDDWVGDRSLQGEARFLLASAYRLQGNVDSALREAELSVRVFEREEQTARAIPAILLAAETAWQGRRIEEARRWLEQGLAATERTGDDEKRVKFLSLAATVAHLRGEYEKSKEYLDLLERLTSESKDRKEEEQVPTGGNLVVAIPNAGLAGEPLEISRDEDVEILSLVFEPLVTSDDDGRLVPSLCESWEMLEEGKSILLTLRQGVLFHDGWPLRAADVRASFERTIRLRQREMRPAFTAIEGMTAFREQKASEVSGIIVHSDFRLEIRLAESLPIYPALLTDGATGIVRSMVDGDGVEQVVGTGPFRMAEHRTDFLRLERNPDHWSSPPPLSSIEFRSLESASAIASGLRSGQIDLARDLLPRDLEEILRDSRFRPGLVEAPKKNTYFVLFNDSGPLRDALGKNDFMTLRRVLCGAVRVRDLVWQSLGRLALPASSLIPPGIFGHDPGRKRSPLSREEAQQMLRSTKLSFPLTLKASVHPLLQDRYRSLTAALFELWSDLGVEVSIETKTMESYLDSFESNDGLDMIISRWNADYDDPDNFTDGLFNTRNGVYKIYFASAETDQLLEDARRESRPAVREGLYRKFETFLTDNGILLPLFHEIDYRVASPAVRRLHLRSTPPYVNYAQLARADRPSPVATPQGTVGGIIHVPIVEEIISLDPIRVETLEESEVISTVFQTLTHNEGTRVVPWLASRIAVEEGGRRYRILLREGVRFHDGRRLTARDVRSSWERLLANDGPSRWFLSPIRGASAFLDGKAHDLEGFSIISQREFTIDLETPLAFFPAMLSFASTAIYPEGTTQISGTWRDGCAGTGPFRVVGFQSGREIELERNPSYWRAGFPKSDGLVFHCGIAPDQILSGFKEGRFHLASDLFPNDVEALRQDPQFAAGYHEVPRLSTCYVTLNARRGPLQDVELRRRLLHDVDVAAMIRRSIGRLAIPAHGLIPPGVLGHKAAGSWVVPAAGSNGDGRGNQPDLELSANFQPMFFGQYASIGEEVARHFRSRGARLKIAHRTMPEFLSIDDAGEADLSVGRWNADYPDADTFMFGVLHSKSGTIGRYCGSPELDRLVERGRSELDPGARYATYRQVEELVARDALLLPLLHEQVYRFVRPGVNGLTLNFVVPEVTYENLHFSR
jgi:peptide/nickel transport system substrate-binding protein